MLIRNYDFPVLDAGDSCRTLDAPDTESQAMEAVTMGDDNAVKDWRVPSMSVVGRLSYGRDDGGFTAAKWADVF